MKATNPKVSTDPLLKKACANKGAIWHTFDNIGSEALFSVLVGRLSYEDAISHLGALRRMKLEDATMSDVYCHLRRHKLITEYDDMDFSYYYGN